MTESVQLARSARLGYARIPAVWTKTSLVLNEFTKLHPSLATRLRADVIRNAKANQTTASYLLEIDCSRDVRACAASRHASATTVGEVTDIVKADHKALATREGQGCQSMTQPGHIGDSYDVVILSNGPGEVATWVKSVVKALRARFGEDRQHLRISVVLSPCPHASQQEAALVQSFPGVDRCQEAQHFSSLLLWGQTADGWDWRKRGVSLFLGGDQFNALVLGWRLGYKTVLYAEEAARWPCLADQYCLRHPSLLSAIPSFAQGRCRVVGDLFVAAVNGATGTASTTAAGTATSTQSITPPLTIAPHTFVRPPNGASSVTSEQGLAVEGGIGNEGSDRLRSHSEAGPREPPGSVVTVGILPGSKPVKLGLGVPYFLAAVDHIHAELPSVRFVLPLAPTVTLDQLATHASSNHNPNIRRFGWASASMHRAASSGRPRFAGASHLSPVATLTTRGGACVDVYHHFPAYDVFRDCDLCLTTIGTNTAELGSLAIPMIVALPTHSLEVFRGATGGLGGLVARLPGPVGEYAARAVNAALLESAGFVAWPNRWAGEAVVPELIGRIEPLGVAAVALNHLRHPARLKGMHERLKSLNRVIGGQSTHGQGAAEQIAQCLEEVLDSG